MKFPIDVIFLSEKNQVVHIINSMQPWKTSEYIFDASCVVEVSSGVVQKTMTKLGDILKI